MMDDRIENQVADRACGQNCQQAPNAMMGKDGLVMFHMIFPVTLAADVMRGAGLFHGL